MVFDNLLNLSVTEMIYAPLCLEQNELSNEYEQPSISTLLRLTKRINLFRNNPNESVFDMLETLI